MSPLDTMEFTTLCDKLLQFLVVLHGCCGFSIQEPKGTFQLVAYK
jgi:hypothetical protein